MRKMLQPVLSDMSKFKKFIHGEQATCFQSYSKREGMERKSVAFPGKLTTEMKKKLVAANSTGMEVAMMINQSNGKGRSSSGVNKVNALFADFDDGNMTFEKLMDLPIKPHMIVESSPGKYHAYWLVANCDVDQFKPVMRALAHKLGSDPNVTDLARVMRMPGTINWKYEKPFLASIVHRQDVAEPITLKGFIKRMKLDSDATTPAVRIDADLDGQRFTKEMAARIRSELKHLSADDRGVWQKVGMAIHSVDQTEDGYKLWKEWSETSEKFDEVDQRKRWSEFTPGRGVNIETLFWLTSRAKSGGNNAVDEMALADHFADRFKDQLRYDRDNKHWYHFTGVVWKIDSQSPTRLARQMIVGMSHDDGDLPPSDSVKRFRSAGALKAIVNHAELVDELHIHSQEFDPNPNLLAVKNGVIDLRTGLFRLARAADFLLRQADVEFDEKAECPQWIKFMKSVTRKDVDLYKFIRRALGYTLFGHAELQVFFLAIGSGGNGKGVLARTLQEVLGGYAVSVPPNLLTTAYSGNVNSPTPALARLCGARMVVCTELPKGRKFDEAFVKQYAGGDEITARPGYGNPFSFKPEGKLWLSTNELPELSASDEAMWRRLKPIPFNATFLGEAVDSKLEENLKSEYPGILNWLLKGAQTYFEEGLGSCPAVDELVTKLRKDADSLLAWVSECCVKKANSKTQSSAAYESYLDFMDGQQRKALSQPAFREGLMRRGFVHKKGQSNNFFVGFRLR